jgi:SOS-response transcriptional repressor LexA
MFRETSNNAESINKIPVPFFTGPDADAFVMLDDSMEPKVSVDDIIVIDPAKPYKADKMIAARIKSMDVEVFRKFVYDGPDHVALVPLSPGHRSYKFTHDQWAQDVEVLGTYVGHIHRDE